MDSDGFTMRCIDHDNIRDVLSGFAFVVQFVLPGEEFVFDDGFDKTGGGSDGV